MLKSKLAIDLIILFGLLILCSLYNIFVHYAPGWDFYSYHYYNGWAFLNNRIDIDVMPCMFRTYFNPLMDSFLYLMMKSMNNHPVVFIVLSSFKFGILMFIAYKIYNFLNLEKTKKWTALFFCLILGILSPISIFCNTFDNTDFFGAAVVLFSIYLLLKNIFRKYCIKRNLILFITLLLCGMVVGLKYTNSVYVVAIFISTLLFSKEIDKPIKTFWIMLLGVIIGFLITDGYWMYVLWKKFQNPLFPYFNNFFKSQYANVESIISMDYAHLRKNSFLDILFMPFKNSLGADRVGIEFTYFEPKISIGFLVMFISLFLIKIEKYKARIASIIDVKIFYFLVAFVMFSYYINVFLFGNLRYQLAIFAILPLVIYVCGFQFLGEKSQKYWASCILLFYVLTFKNVGAAREYIGVNKKNIAHIQNMNFENNATILCAGLQTCFFAPAQNPNVKYVALVLPAEIIKDGFYNTVEKSYSNRYFSNKYLENILPKLIKDSDNLYVAFSNESLGNGNYDLKLYEKALKQYSDNKISKIENCQKLNYSFFGAESRFFKYSVCKIK